MALRKAGGQSYSIGSVPRTPDARGTRATARRVGQGVGPRPRSPPIRRRPPGEDFHIKLEALESATFWSRRRAASPDGSRGACSELPGKSTSGVGFFHAFTHHLRAFLECPRPRPPPTRRRSPGDIFRIKL